MFDTRHLILIIISITLISVVLAVSAHTFLIYAQNETKYKAKLTGDSVVPPINTTAAGRAVIFIGNDWLRWKLNVTGVTDPTMAHIHMAKKGVNGSIVADLLNSAKIKNATGRIVISGKITPSNLQGPLQNKTMADLQSAINANGVQIDLHTKNHPNGELRGTIKLQGGNATKQITNSVNATLGN
jgi:hypothetical protein